MFQLQKHDMVLFFVSVSEATGNVVASTQSASDLQRNNGKCGLRERGRE